MTVLRFNLTPNADGLLLFAPGAQPAARGWYEVRGHFDDARSSICVRAPLRPPFLPEAPAEQRTWCRQQLVLTAVTPVSEPTSPSG